jgi:hypothetical protein
MKNGTTRGPNTKHNATPAASTAMRTNHGKARWATEITGAPLGGVEGIGKESGTNGSAAKTCRQQRAATGFKLASRPYLSPPQPGHTVSHGSSRESSPLNAALWLAAGTAAGVLVGVLVADRFGGGKLLDRLSGLLKVAGVEMPDGEGDEVDEEVDEYGAEIHDDEDTDDSPGVDERVLTAFEQDPILSERAIEIDADDPGTIVLRGTVLSAEDITHATTIARGTPGVSQVDNLLRVRTGRPRSPAERSPKR